MYNNLNLYLEFYLARHGVGLSDLVTPVASADREDGQLSEDNGATDGSRHFLAALHAQTDVPVVITDSHKRLETRALTGTGLLLHRHDLQNLIVKGWSQEEINDFKLFDGQREQVDALELVNLALAY